MTCWCGARRIGEQARKRVDAVTAGDVKISDRDCDAIFVRLRTYRRVVLAVSGGVDSMALLQLAAEWRSRRLAGGDSTPEMSVATVDHGLRAQSQAEAAFVADRCAALGLKHHLLTWGGAKPKTGVAEAARTARYTLLLQCAIENHADAVITGHHGDDQAETVIMRLARGSGVAGLAGMRVARDLSPNKFPGGESVTTVIDEDQRSTAIPVQLLRPLLSVSKSQLVAAMQSRDLMWCDDPSNVDVKSERVRIRNSMAQLAAVGISQSALSRTSRRMAEAEAGLRYGDANLVHAALLTNHDGIFASLDRCVFVDAPPILQQRLLQRLIVMFGGTSPAPELSEVEAAAASIANANGQQHQLTLGGVVIAARGSHVCVWREAGRISEREVPLGPGAELLWDARFQLRRAADQYANLSVTVAALGTKGAASVRAMTDDGRATRSGRLLAKSGMPIPAAAIYALPGFYSAGRLIAVPNLDLVATSECASFNARSLHLQSVAIVYPIVPV